MADDPIHKPLAKAALWVTATVLVLAVVRGAHLVLAGQCQGFDEAVVPNAVTAAQVLSIIALYSFCVGLQRE